MSSFSPMILLPSARIRRLLCHADCFNSACNRSYVCPSECELYFLLWRLNSYFIPLNHPVLPKSSVPFLLLVPPGMMASEQFSLHNSWSDTRYSSCADRFSVEYYFCLKNYYLVRWRYVLWIFYVFYFIFPLFLEKEKKGKKLCKQLVAANVSA